MFGRSTRRPPDRKSLNRPIRAIFVVPDLRVGGAERHVTTLLPHLDPATINASLVCIGEKGSLFATLQAAEIPAQALELSGRSNAVRALMSLTKLACRERPDVFIARGYNAEVFATLVARLVGAKTVIWVHNNGDIQPRSRTKQFLDRFLDRWRSAYFGVAETQRAYMIKELHQNTQKITIIHNGVDPTQFKVNADRSVLSEFDIDQGDPIIAIVAALRREKDHMTLLRAAKVVSERFPRAKFLIIGDGEMRPYLETQTKNLQLSGNVIFTGMRSDVHRFLNACDIFALSSSTVECFPMALLEAMASGRPAVCTSVGGVAEMLEHGATGFLVPIGDSRLLASHITTLLHDRALAARFGRAARKRVEQEFSLEKSVSLATQAIVRVATEGC